MPRTIGFAKNNCFCQALFAFRRDHYSRTICYQYLLNARDMVVHLDCSIALSFRFFHLLLIRSEEMPSENQMFKLLLKIVVVIKS